MAKNRQNRLITFVIFLLTIFHVAGQVTVIGTVVDIEGNEPLVGASVLIKGPNKEIRYLQKRWRIFHVATVSS